MRYEHPIWGNVPVLPEEPRTVTLSEDRAVFCIGYQSWARRALLDEPLHPESELARFVRQTAFQMARVVPAVGPDRRPVWLDMDGLPVEIAVEGTDDVPPPEVVWGIASLDRLRDVRSDTFEVVEIRQHEVWGPVPVLYAPHGIPEPIPVRIRQDMHDAAIAGVLCWWAQVFRRPPHTWQELWRAALMVAITLRDAANGRLGPAIVREPGYCARPIWIDAELLVPARPYIIPR